MIAASFVTASFSLSRTCMKFPPLYRSIPVRPSWAFFLAGLLQERLEFGLGEWLQSRARIYDMKHRTHLYWRVLSRAHGREGKNRRPRGKGIFITSTARWHRPLRKAGRCLKNKALMRFRPLILGLRSMQVGAQCSSLLLARKSVNCLGDVRHSSARVLTGQPSGPSQALFVEENTCR
jgi:hypothetical protein